jgi:hypothetical protein
MFKILRKYKCEYLDFFDEIKFMLPENYVQHHVIRSIK